MIIVNLVRAYKSASMSITQNEYENHALLTTTIPRTVSLEPG